MIQSEDRIESMLFDYETTYRTSYKGGEIKEYPKTVYSGKTHKRDRGLPPYRNIHTMSQWKNDVMPPFDLLIKPKEIVRTNPNDVQKPYGKPVDIDREQAQKTRPRLVMTPAVSMDDIADARARDILCTDMYTSDMSRATREAVAPVENVKAPFPGRPAPSNPIVLAKLQPPYVSPEWRMESLSWDRGQARGYCDPTKEFWLSRELSKCKACEETATVKAHRKMQLELKKRR